MYKAVFIDLDGTLLRNDHSISLETRGTIQKLIEKDMLVALVSARPVHGIIPISNWLGLQSFPLVSLNGSYILSDNEVIFESSIDPQTISGIHSIKEDFDVTLIYYSGMKWYAETANPATAKEQRITDIQMIQAPFESLLEEWKLESSYPNKMMAIGNETEITAFQSRLLQGYHDGMNIYTSKPTYLEMMRKDASKTNAVRFLLKKFNIICEESIAFGDNYNDREMIIYAGKGIAMGNAPEAIKAIADYVTDTNENDGVRKAIEKFIAL